MPTLLKWTYDGGAPDSAEAARRGEQRAFSGDKVEDDVFGTGVLTVLSGIISHTVSNVYMYVTRL